MGFFGTYQNRTSKRCREKSLAGVVLLVLSMIHAPLPQPDFHKIRHQDGPGEVCEYHDHLLRWHPRARVGSDVAVLHWHWFLPVGDSDDETFGTSPGRSAIHSHSPDWDPADTVEIAQLSADTSVRLELRLSNPHSEASVLGHLFLDQGRHLQALFQPRSHDCAHVARRVSLQTLLNRWVC